ncbi:unnamed protein product [Cylindrotheca closterium]|uniref:Uncharacterized protein n=1 Tax=Cylindrotheca closterium TaxID=2856 RepID=A0AAD2GDV7_9STRA|nr:unnamed protein product [Cylindrotheca closterium]
MSTFSFRFLLPATNDPYAWGTILASCSTAAIAIYYYNSCQHTKKQSSVDDELVVKLLSIEQVLAMGGGGDNAMSTLTWFKMTDSGDNLDKTKQILQDRFHQIIKANPWMIGRILKRNGEHSLVYPKQLWDDTKDGSMSEYFGCLHNDDGSVGISPGTPYDQLGSRLSHLMLKNGPNEALCRVTILPSRSDKRQYFAVVFTMSHVIADGATFFKMNNMLLNVQEDIVSLDPQRIMSTEQQQIQVMGGEPEYKILQSGGFIANMVLGVFTTLLKPSKKASARFYLVNQDGMKDEKEKHQYDTTSTPKKQFVSTNDVLSSWFFQNSTCKHGLMALNWRGRLPGHTDMLAGNYENVLFYRPCDSKTPDLIRKSLTEKKNQGQVLQYRRQVTHDEPMPGFWGMASGSIALATNWASFSKLSSIPGWQEEIQIPLYDTSKLLPSTLAIMLIFRAGPHGTGIMVAGSPEKLANLENTVPFLSKEPL